MSPSLAFTDSLHRDIRRAFYDHHQALAQVMHLVLVLLPLAGWWLRGMVGAVLGLTLFILSYYLLPYAWQTTHRHPQ